MKNDLNTAQVAQMLGIHRNTVNKLVRDGLLHPYRTSGSTGHMRFTEEDIENFKNSRDIRPFQPSEIISRYSAMYVNHDDDSKLSIKGISSRKDDYLLHAVLKAASIEDIFGKFLKNADSRKYAEAMKGQSDIWIAETMINLAQMASKNSQLAYAAKKSASRLSVGIGSVDVGGYKKPYITFLIFKGEDGDIIISGTIQQYLSLEKGLLVIKKEHAESLFINLKELSMEEYMLMQLSGNYSEYIDAFMGDVFNLEINDDEEEQE